MKALDRKRLRDLGAFIGSFSTHHSLGERVVVYPSDALKDGARVEVRSPR